ncbi:MAG: L-histidine N(alpha)-methyltransferase [Vicinamibacterales bacterium]
MCESSMILAAPPCTALASDVRETLQRSPREIASRYLYDELGSVLFDAICRLPWYKVTRSELALLDQHAPEIVEAAGRPSRIVELGPGRGDKLTLFLERGWTSPGPLAVDLIDVSQGALDAARQQLAAHDHVAVTTWPMSYENGLRAVGRAERAGVRTLALFLGSNIGNFDPPEAAHLLAQVRAVLAPGDGLLIGTDLVKPEGELLAAYDDPLGVTAAFNRNLLVRLNRELGADFDLSRFSHRAVWRADPSRVEMHLVSRTAQTVRVPGADLVLKLAAGETILTERSYKYEADGVRQWLGASGFVPVGQWGGPVLGFALTLARVP